MKYYLSIVLFLSALVGFSQTKTLQLDPDFPPQISITGTSSLHDWKVTGDHIADLPQSLQITFGSEEGIANFGFKVPVESLDGGRGASMNGKIKTAFKSPEHPEISYTQTAPAKLDASGSKEMTFVSAGELSMAGLQKPVSVTVTTTIDGDHITFKGSHAMNMSDFAIDPPSAMFGQIKTRDAVVVHFEIRYKVKP